MYLFFDARRDRRAKRVKEQTELPYYQRPVADIVIRHPTPNNHVQIYPFHCCGPSSVLHNECVPDNSDGPDAAETDSHLIAKKHTAILLRKAQGRWLAWRLRVQGLWLRLHEGTCGCEFLRLCVSFLLTALTPSCALTRMIETVQWAKLPDSYGCPPVSSYEEHRPTRTLSGAVRAVQSVSRLQEC